MEALECLPPQLRRLLPLLSHSPLTLSYRESVRPEAEREATTPLQLLVLYVFNKVGVVPEVEYSRLLLKKLILTRFTLLCASSEVIHDVEYSFDEFKEILLAVELFNGRCLDSVKQQSKSSATFTLIKTPSRSNCIIELADLMDAYINTHTEWLSSSLSSTSSSGDLLFLAQFESSFSRALLGNIATHTSLLSSGRTMKFVSEEMFNLLSSKEAVGWLDCLIPGAQSEMMRRTCNDVLLRLWSKVAEDLVMRAQPVAMGGCYEEEALQSMLRGSDTESFPVLHAVRSLKHVSDSCHQQQCLINWDAGFRKLLAAILMDYRKGHRVLKSKPSPMTALCSSTLNVLDQHMSEQTKGIRGPVTTDCCKSIVAHIRTLRHSFFSACAMKASLSQVAFSLLQSLGSSTCSWNLTRLAGLLFKGLPLITSALRRSVAITYTATSPRVSFPAYSSHHSQESSCRELCSSLHNISTYLQERVREWYECFQMKWASRCRQVLESSFPQVKYWKNLRNKGGRQHSAYCDVVLEYLFLPVMEAAMGLPAEEQKNFLYLMLTIFYNEYRKVITANKRLYSIFAGRQLLTDCRYMHRWLTSSERRLSKPSLQLLSTLPTLTEVERGLLTVCGMAEEEEETDGERALDISLPFSNNLPVLVEVAWNSTQDWNNCTS